MTTAHDPMHPDDVRKIARLARLALTDQQIHAYAAQLNQTLGYMERLRELDLDDVEPLTNPADLDNVTRPDEPSPAADQPGSTRLATADLMRMAPAAIPPFVKVPKTLGDDGGA